MNFAGRRLLIALMVCAPAVARAAEDPAIQGPPPPRFPEVIARDAQGRVTLRTQRVPSPLNFDGNLDEPFYQDVPSFGDFIQQEPHEGQAATDRTEVWVFYDRDYLYVSARLWESEGGHRVSTEMRRDANNLYTDDHFGLTFDGFYDRRNGYGFAVNALGGLLDWSINNEQPNNSWNGVWDARTSDFEGGWTVEIRFPFRSFRFQDGGHVWGINFRRMVRWKNEVAFLAPVMASWGRLGMSKMSVAATLTGLEVPGKGKNVDFKPYALGSVLTDKKAASPYTNDPDGNVGFDVKWGVRQTLVADLTVNTDFAQVEDDEQQVNLTRFSLLFPEKRDFFLEGADTFNFGNSSVGTGSTGGGGGVQGSGQNTSTAPLVFYSRRIGLNNGIEVPIRAGGRLIGRAGPWRLGALNIQTAESLDAKAPSTNFSVLRVSRDFLRRSRVGIIATRRDPIAATPVGGSSPGNLAYGIDSNINPTNEISVLGYLARTDSPGKVGNNTSYRGVFNWNADRYGLQSEHLLVEPNFNPEVGFLRRTSFRRSFGQARFSPRPGWRGIRKVYYIGSLDYITDIHNRPESKELQGTYQMDLENSDTWSVDLTRNYERLVNRFEIGKNVFVPAGEYDFNQIRGTYTLGTQRPLSGSVTAARGSFYNGTLSEITWRGRIGFSRRFYAEPTVSWNRVNGPGGQADSNLLSSRGTFTISPRMFVSALAQYQSRTDNISLNARFRWEYIAGSELFIVYSDGRTTLNEGFPAVENASFVVKVTRLVRW